VSPPGWAVERQGQLVWGCLATAMALAAVLLLWEGRGLTLFVDEWSFGFGSRRGLSVAELLEPANGHLVPVPVLITKASLELFGAGTALPLRLVCVALHLGVVVLLFVFLRRALGDLAALIPAISILFLGSASDLLVGSHGMPMLIAVASGLGAWLLLEMRTTAGDVAAALLLFLGLASNGLALLFVAGAIAALLLPSDRSLRRLWLTLAPLGVYLVWRLAYGGDGGSDFAVANLAGLPAFAFDSLGAELAALTGLFPEPGFRQQSFNPTVGPALAGAVVVGLAALFASGRRPPLRAAIPAVGLLALWSLTGAIAGPARLPESARYLYPGAILVLLVVGGALSASPVRWRGSLVLAGICAIGLLPNLRELHYGADFFRLQSNQDRAVLAAADLLGGSGPAGLKLEDREDPGLVGTHDLSFTLGDYRDAKDRYGTPAFSLAQLRTLDASSRQAADRFLVRALGLAAVPARRGPRALPADVRADAPGGRLVRRGGCLRFAPKLPGAKLTVSLPRAGIWIQPRSGPAVSVGLYRFADGFPVAVGEAPAGGPSMLTLPAGPASAGWVAQLAPQQPLRVCRP
jgi:hypothetical protein